MDAAVRLCKQKGTIFISLENEVVCQGRYHSFIFFMLLRMSASGDLYLSVGAFRLILSQLQTNAYFR